MGRPSTPKDMSPEEREALLEAMRHPVKTKILLALAERQDVTIRQMAVRMKEPARRIRHHVGALLDAGLVQVTGEDMRRGVVEHRYGGPASLEFETDDWPDTELRVVFMKEVVRLLLSDIGAAAAAGTFATHRDLIEARFYGEVDDTCFEELVEIGRRAYREIERAVAAGRERVRRRGEPGAEIVATLLFFESPLWGTAPAESE